MPGDEVGSNDTVGVEEDHDVPTGSGGPHVACLARTEALALPTVIVDVESLGGFDRRSHVLGRPVVGDMYLELG
jgi:hypothetical protein